MKILERAYSREFAFSMAAGEELPTVSGYGVIFNEIADYGWFYQLIEPGAVDAVFADPEIDCAGLFNHDPNYLLARYQPSKGADSLILKPDEKGVYYEFKCPDHFVGRYVAENVRLKNITGSSFCWYTESDDWQDTFKGMPLRRIKVIASMQDIGPVTYPAYSGSTVNAASKGNDQSLRERYEAAKSGASPVVVAPRPVPREALLLDIEKQKLDLI